MKHGRGGLTEAPSHVNGKSERLTTSRRVRTGNASEAGCDIRITTDSTATTKLNRATSATNDTVKLHIAVNHVVISGGTANAASRLSTPNSSPT